MRDLHNRISSPSAARRVTGILAAALLCATALAVPVTAAAATTTGTSDDATPQLANGLALTPPMGFNNWNSTNCRAEFNETMVEGIADIFVNKGLKAAGYQYVNLDDCWALPQRDSDGKLVPDRS
jgi:alpha-galactosidase